MFINNKIFETIHTCVETKNFRPVYKNKISHNQNDKFIFCHLGAIVFAGLLIANVKARYTNEHQPITVKNAKQIFYWISCEPFFGVLPSLFSLIFIIWLEVNLFHWVNNDAEIFSFNWFLCSNGRPVP